MKMVIISYNEVMDEEVMDALTGCRLKNYTKIMGVFGRGETSGTHMGSDVWPGKNNVIYIACEEKEAKALIASVKELRKRIGKEGIKAFVMPLEEVT